MVWLLKRAVYGGPDAGRLWYNTYAHYLLKEEAQTPFTRCHFEPCAFTHFCSPYVVSETPTKVVYAPASAVPERILCLIYVDDGRTWDNCSTVCDAFYKRLGERFAITMEASSLKYMIGMDIELGEGWVRIYTATYITGMCAKWLPYPIEEYEHVDGPAHPKLMMYYEQALMLRGNTSAADTYKYKSLIGGLIFPAPITRPDCLHTVGIHARAMDFSTPDLFKTALRCLVFMGQSKDDGLLYSRHAHDGRRLRWWTDSDWDVNRSTTGGTGQLAGSSIHATSKRQDCRTGSSTHAEIVAASTNSNDVVWARGLLEEYGLPQHEPTPLMVDAKNVLTLVYNLISSKLTRHITRREMIVRERENDGTLAVEKVHTDDNLSDMFTKVLDRTPYTKLRKLVMNLLVRSVTATVPRARRGTSVHAPL